MTCTACRATAVEKPETDKPSTGMDKVDIYNELVSWGHWRQWSPNGNPNGKDGAVLYNTKQE